MARKDKEFYLLVKKFNAVIEDVTELSKAGRPVLIGTNFGRDFRIVKPNVENERRCTQCLECKMHKRSANCEEAGKPGW
jgi:preprotein translocase subunit SecA